MEGGKEEGREGNREVQKGGGEREGEKGKRSK